jgi:hypothetical protein
MASVNRVLLLGLVAAPARQRKGGCELVIAVPEERAGRTWLERIVLIVPDRLVQEVMELRPAQPVHAEGSLARASTGAVVVVDRLFSLGAAPAEQPAPRQPVRSHASPLAHERAGHPRRIHIGRPDERIIWVRPARVGGCPSGAALPLAHPRPI